MLSAKKLHYSGRFWLRDDCPGKLNGVFFRCIHTLSYPHCVVHHRKQVVGQGEGNLVEHLWDKEEA